MKKLQEKMENTIKLIEARNRYTSKKAEQLAEQNDKTTEEVAKKNMTEPSNMIMETVSNENFVILNNTIASLSYTLQEHESRGFKIAFTYYIRCLKYTVLVRLERPLDGIILKPPFKVILEESSELYANQK